MELQEVKIFKGRIPGILVCVECRDQVPERYAKSIVIHPGECAICGSKGVMLDFYEREREAVQGELFK